MQDPFSWNVGAKSTFSGEIHFPNRHEQLINLVGSFRKKMASRNDKNVIYMFHYQNLIILKISFALQHVGFLLILWRIKVRFLVPGTF